ncbi:MAG: DNA-binding protein [Bacteroidota bacterium]|nr:DNA-binding protein [Bacteroidota bacterium]
MYTYKEVGGGRYVLSLDNHVEISAALKAFCEEKGIYAGTVYGLGAVNKAIFRYLNPETMKYVDKTFEEQMEITNLTGNISSKDGQVYLHLHITASRSDYSCIGGHLLTAWISGACELIVEAFDATIGRRLDPDLGINLYDL